MFEREGKSVATEQGAGVEGCDPAHLLFGEALIDPARACSGRGLRRA